MKQDPKSLYNIEFFKQRRQRLAQIMPKDSALVLFAASEPIRNGDVPHEFRQDSDLFYLTGYEEADSIFIFRPGSESASSLFVQKKDPQKETWDGFLFGTQGAKDTFHVDQVFENTEFEAIASKLLADITQVFYKNFSNFEHDQKMAKVLNSVKRSKGRSGLGLMSISDPLALMGQLRVKKTEEEVQIHRKSCQISSEAHVALMKAVKPGISERELQGLFFYETMKRGAQRQGYSAIVASGSHATTLHYKSNSDICGDNELLLVDAGAEYNYLSADITRTYPVNGKFTPAQKEVYERVLDVQKKMISRVNTDADFKKLNEMAIDMIAENLIDLGLIKKSKAEIIDKKLFVKYYPHSLGHYLGMDVHDVGAYYNADLSEPIKFEPGYTLTIEPGIYIPKNDPDASPEFRGIGVRIEDNILVTDQGFENLSHDCPKEVAELEDIICQKH